MTAYTTKDSVSEERLERPMKKSKKSKKSATDKMREMQYPMKIGQSPMKGQC